MPALPLDSPRWRQLRSHFANADGNNENEETDLWNVPLLLERWHGAVGSYAEEYAYAELFEAYLHQGTILNVAYAVVPHLAARLPEIDPDRRLELIDDISRVEDVRLQPVEQLERTFEEMRRTIPEPLREQFIQNTRDRHPPLPEDLAHAYFEGIRNAQRAAIELVGGAGKDEEAFRLLLSAISRLHGQPILASILDDLDQEQLSEHVKQWAAARQRSPRHWRRHVAFLRAAGWRPEDIEFGVTALKRETDDDSALIYREREEGLAGLRELQPATAPAGWFERTKILGKEGVLAFNALRSFAWVSLRVDLATLLRDAGLKS